MNGIPKAYNSILKNILTTGKLDNLSKEEKNTLTAINEFSTAWAAKDPSFLLNQILEISSDTKLDFLSGVTGTPDAELRPDQKAYLLGSLDLQVDQSISSIGGGAIVNLLKGSPSFQRDVYPGLQVRRQVLQGSTVPMTYADYFVFFPASCYC
jgi:hypothetical protein